MYYRERNDREYLVGTRDLNVNELVEFDIEGIHYRRRIEYKEITKITSGEDAIIEVGVYTLSTIFGPLDSLKFTEINITDFKLNPHKPHMGRRVRKPLKR